MDLKTKKLIDVAFEYHQAGFNILPVKLVDKKPLSSWSRWQKDKQSEDDVLDMFKNVTNPLLHGIAIIMGEISGNAECIDFDNKVKNIENIAMNVYKSGVPFYAETTQNNGFHLMFRNEKVEDLEHNQKLAGHINETTNKKEFFIETRGEGGYVVVFPSQGYNLISDFNLSQIPVIDKNNKDFIYSLCRSMSEIIPDVKKINEPSLNKCNDNLNDFNESESGYNVAVEVLIEAGWKYAGTNGKYENYTRPNKNKGVSGGFIERKIFNSFTSNSDFEINHSYNLFGMISVLKFNSDHKATFKWLLSKNLIKSAKEKDVDSSIVPNAFWKVTKEKKVMKLEINDMKLIDFLELNGFRKIYVGANPVFVKIKNNVIEEVNINMIQDFLFAFIDTLPDEITEEGHSHIDLKNSILKNINHFFSDKFISVLKPIEPNFKKDTKDKCFFFYQNCWVEVNKDGWDTLPYSQLDGIIWNTEILDRDYELTECSDDFMFRKFMRNVCSDKNDRLLSLCCSIGYLLHTYKDEATTKSIIYCDEGDEDNTDVDDCQGRSGKSLIAEKAVSKMRNLVKEDGRNFKFDKGFAFQKLKLDTQVYLFDDTNKNFPFDRLFSIITGNIPVEKKNVQEFVIPFADAPKLVITTNYTIADKSDSARARKFEVEFSRYYNFNKSPKDEFGKTFFNDWDATEWKHFDSLMFECVVLHLIEGLPTYNYGNILMKQLRQSAGQDFIDWIEQNKEGDLNGDIYLKDAVKSFETNYGHNRKYKITTQRFAIWIKDYCDILGLKYSTERNRKKGEREGDRYIRITST